MSEATMWGRVRKALKGLDPVRVENRVELGTPDVNYVEGWIELKNQKRKPRDADKIFILDHYTPEQSCWATRRAYAGGRVFLLLKVSNEWMLFMGHVAAEYLNKVSLNELRKVCIGRWVKKLNDQELRNLLLN